MSTVVDEPVRGILSSAVPRRPAFALALAVLAASAAPAAAGGLYISEFATPSMGTADAGSQAWADNASAALHNPASMTRLEEHEVLAGVGVGITQVEFDTDRAEIEGDDGGNAGSIAPLSTISGVYRLSDRWRAGLSVGGITGAALDYNRNWVGRFQVTDVSLAVVGATPSVAYKVTDWLSLGAGATLVYARLNQTIRPSVEGGDGRIKIDDADDTDVTYNLSAMIELSERTRFGIVYNSEADLNLSGDVDVQPVDLASNVGLDFKFPQWVKAGVYHDLNDQARAAGLGPLGGLELVSTRFRSPSIAAMPPFPRTGATPTAPRSACTTARPTGCCCKPGSPTTRARSRTPTAAPSCRSTSSIASRSACNTTGPRR